MGRATVGSDEQSPAAWTCCFTPEPGYLEVVREMTRRAGTVLIFDEVITGYCLSLGGAQEWCGRSAVTYLERHANELYPKLATHSKTLADILETEATEGGLPLTVNQVVGAAYGFVSRRPARTPQDGLDTDLAAYRAFAAALLEAGVHVIPRGLLYVSIMHTDEDLRQTRDAVRRAASAVAMTPVLET